MSRYGEVRLANRSTQHPRLSPPVPRHGIMPPPLRLAEGRSMLPIQRPLSRPVSSARLACEIRETGKNTWTSSGPKSATTETRPLPKSATTRTLSLPKPTTAPTSSSPTPARPRTDRDRNRRPTGQQQDQNRRPPGQEQDRTGQQQDALRPARRIASVTVCVLFQEVRGIQA